MNLLLTLLIITQFRYLTRAEIMDSTRPFAEVTWYCDSANVAPVPECPDWYPDYQAGHTYQGMAYEYGGWDRVGRFLDKLQAGYRAGAHSDNDCISGGGDPWWATGQDCSGLVSRAWQLPYKHSTGMLPDISHQIDWNELLPGDIIDWPRHHVVIFDAWADSNHTHVFIYQATDRRPNPSTTGRDYRNIANYMSYYTPYRYNFLINIEEDPIPQDNRAVADVFLDGSVPTLRFNPLVNGRADVSVFDVAGRVVSSVNMEITGGEHYQLPLSKSGVYFVRVNLNGHRLLQKKIVYVR